MRLAVLVVAASLAGLSLTTLAPEASAFGWCTAAGPAGHECRSHVVCIGWSWGQYYERCSVGIPDGWFYCPGPLCPELP